MLFAVVLIGFFSTGIFLEDGLLEDLLSMVLMTAFNTLFWIASFLSYFHKYHNEIVINPNHRDIEKEIVGGFWFLVMIGFILVAPIMMVLLVKAPYFES